MTRKHSNDFFRERWEGQAENNNCKVSQNYFSMQHHAVAIFLGTKKIEENVQHWFLQKKLYIEVDSK